MSGTVTIERLVTRTPYASIFVPRGSPDAFGRRLATLLQRCGMAVYHLEMGVGPEDTLHASRATPPESALVFVEYTPRAYQLRALLLAVLRWKLQGRWVVICRRPAPFDSPRQRTAYGLVRRLADLELVAPDPVTAIAGWPDDKLPPVAPLGRVWQPKPERSRVDEIVRILACPACRGPLRLERTAVSATDERALASGRLVCEHCAAAYDVINGIPVLLPPGAVSQVDEVAEAYPAGDACKVGSDAGRAWLEIGLFKRDFVSRLLERRRPRASLDIGCGDWGLHHDVAAALGSELSVAGDVSLRLVEHARDYASAPGRVHYVVMSAEVLPFRDGVFDLAYCSEVLEHLDRPEAALAEMARVAPGGRVILSVPDEKITGKLEPGHIQTFGYDDFIALVERFAVVRKTWGVLLYIERAISDLPRTWYGTARLWLYLRLGLLMPRRSLSILVDGMLRRP